MEITEMTFEQALQELERTVTRLENEALTLEEALALYKRGLSLFEYCRARLQEAEGWVKQVVPTASGYELRPWTTREEWESGRTEAKEDDDETDDIEGLEEE
ncbi:MAG: exodeoxyribonuclease VII small subunit [bacterium JZ-2024 1]